MQNQTIGCIGVGNMAQALISGLLNNGFSTGNIKISDTNKKLLSTMGAKFNLETFKDSSSLTQACSIVILAVKPQTIVKVCHDIQTSLVHNPLIISIAAGVRIDDISRWLKNDIPVVRVMPNTPALIKQGVSGLLANTLVDNKQKSLAYKMFSSVGKCFWFNDEKMLDVVTALSGSGPAYFFLMIEAMTKAGISLGLEKDIAQEISIQTSLGASMMVSKSTKSPNKLRAQVTSPNGTTKAGVEALQDNDFELVVSHAIRTAFTRAYEIGNELSNE